MNKEKIKKNDLIECRTYNMIISQYNSKALSMRIDVISRDAHYIVSNGDGSKFLTLNIDEAIKRYNEI